MHKVIFAILAVFATTPVFASVFASDTNVMTRTRLLPLLNYTPEVFPLDEWGFKGARFLSYRDNQETSATLGLELCVIEVRRGTFKLKAQDIRAEGSPKEAFSRRFGKETLAAINGGFFGVDKQGRLMSLGFLKSGGQVISKRHPWNTGGVISFSDRGVQIEEIRRFRDSGAISDALQSKPMLIEDGNDGIGSSTPDRFDRSAVAVTQDRSLLLFVLHDPNGRAATLAEFSTLALKLRSNSGQPIVDALALDGGPGAHLFVPPLKRHCGSGVPTYIPNAIRITK